MKLNHFGIITKKLEKNISLYLSLGYSLKGSIVDDMFQMNRIAIMSAEFSPNIELIEPLDGTSSICNFKEGYHHICYEAEHGEDIIQKFKEMKIGKIFTKPMIAPELDNRQVVFACLQNGTLIELILS